MSTERGDQLAMHGLLRELARAGAGAGAGDERFIAALLVRCGIRPPVRPRAAARPRVPLGQQIRVSRSSVPRLIALAASALVLAGAWFAARVFMQAPVATLARAEGPVRCAGRPATAGQALRTGTELTCADAWAQAIIVYADGSQVELHGSSRMTVEGDRRAGLAFLHVGGLTASVRPRTTGRSFVVRTPQATATVLGTTFSVRVDQGATRIRTVEGRVAFVRLSDGAAVVVESGRTAVAAEGVKLEPVPFADEPPPVPPPAPLAVRPWEVPPARTRPPIPAGHRVVDVRTSAELAAAVRGLRSRTTIRLQPGTYRGQTFVLDNVHDVAVRGATSDFRDAVVLGNGMGKPHEWGNVFAVHNAQNVLFADLSIGESRNHPIQLTGGRQCRAVRLYHCRLFNGGETLLKAGAGCDDGVVEYCVFEHDKLDPASGMHGGVDLLEGRDWRIEHSLFRNLTAVARAEHAFFYFPAVNARDRSAGTVVNGNMFVNCNRAVGFGVTGPGDHENGRISNNFVCYARDYFDREFRKPDGTTQREGADAPITLWGSRNTLVLHNTILCNDNFRCAIEVRWQTEGTRIAGNLADAPIGTRDGGTAQLVHNKLDATPDMFLSFDPGQAWQLGAPDADGWPRVINGEPPDLRLRPSALTTLERIPACLDTDFFGVSRSGGAGSVYGAAEAGPAPGTEEARLP
ncbi:MAG: FecR domain-containing protein [Kiritimatiellae bacterium]|nr:FecR domain-containing protein [Kiritimatiellia bacterium]